MSLQVDLGINTLGTLIHCELLEQEQDAGIVDNYYKTIAVLYTASLQLSGIPKI